MTPTPASLIVARVCNEHGFDLRADHPADAATPAKIDAALAGIRDAIARDPEMVEALDAVRMTAEVLAERAPTCELCGDPATKAEVNWLCEGCCAELSLAEAEIAEPLVSEPPC